MARSLIKLAAILGMFAALTLLTNAHAAIKMKPTPLVGLNYPGQLLTGDYDPAITNPQTLLGFEVGVRTATPRQIVDSINHWAQSSDKMQLVEYARSHEGRPLYYAIISSPENLAKIDTVKADLARLANPKDLSQDDAKAIIDRLPAVAWMAYSIHGNESSGADSALAAIYHLIAAKDQSVQSLLDQSIIIIDPSMNPDGRARFTKDLQQNRGIAPNVDDQSLLHTGLWPYGRTNHYLFDLNRDFILGVHPETVGRVEAIGQWHPQLMIDGHEMGAQSSFLFAPAREPINKNLSPLSKKWGEQFATEQAQAFDQKNWPYYTGEWFENLYPGYSSFAEFRGSIHILYEQARMAEDGVRQENGRILSYQEAVHHQLISTLTNLQTLANHSKALYQDFLTDRRKSISASGPYADRTFAILPSENQSRLTGFVDLMELQGFDIYINEKKRTFNNALNQLGEKVSVEIPKGAIILPNRQAEARLLAAILEFDAQIDNEVLVEERQKVLRDGSSIMYDTTAWNLTMLHGVTAYTLPTHIDSDITPYKAPTVAKTEAAAPAIAFVVDGADDASLGFAAQLMEQGVQVRVLDKASVLDGVDISRGSVVVYRYDNEYLNLDLDQLVAATAAKMHVKATPIGQGLGKGDLPDIGGAHFRILKQPKIALLAGGGLNTYDYGSIWHSIDSQLGIRHSHLDVTTFNFADLRRYNTLVVPDRYYGEFDNREVEALNSWVKAGGSLIVIGSSTNDFTKPKAEFSQVRQLKDAIDSIESYDLALQQEWLAKQVDFTQMETIWQHQVTEEVDYPWSQANQSPDKDQLKKQLDWQNQFVPSGAIVAARVDQKHWLTFGSPEYIPVLVSNNPVLMSDNGSEAAIRFGVLEKMDKSMWQKITASFKDEPIDRKIGWSSLPDEYQLRLRMSGLLWPEASHRIANSAYLTRESSGEGQIIMFASQPSFRGSTLATRRLLLNALVYGPGLGTNQPITDL